MTMLGQLVSEWKRKNKNGLEKELNFYKEECPRGREQVIELAARGLGDGGRKHDHQRLIPPETLRKFSRKLLADSKQWPDKLSFSELFYNVERTANNVEGGGIGSLAIYDTALRIGWFMGMEPDVVYLQRGALWGARVLMRKGKLNIRRLERSVPASCFPGELKELKAYQIENFLCTMRKDMETL